MPLAGCLCAVGAEQEGYTRKHQHLTLYVTTLHANGALVTCLPLTNTSQAGGSLPSQGNLQVGLRLPVGQSQALPRMH